MDKIKFTHITHLMAQIKWLVDDSFISCTVNPEGRGQTYVHLRAALFLELFDQYETTPFDKDTEELSTNINGVNVLCLVRKK